MKSTNTPPAAYSLVTCKSKGPERVRASGKSVQSLAVKGSRTVVLGHNALGIVGESFGLRQKVQSLEHLRIRFRPDLQALILTESIDEDLSLDVGLDPVVVIHEISLRVRDVRLIQRLAEVLHNGIIHFEALRRMMIHHIALGVVEERVMLQQRVLKVIALDRRNHDIRRDAAAAIYRAAAVGELHFAVGVAARFGFAVVVVVVERNVAVVALDQPSTGRVIVRRGERQASIFRQRIHSLHQTLAKRDFARDQPAVVVLNRSGNNLRRRSGEPVHQNHQRIILPAVAMLRHVTLLGGSAPMMRDDELTFLQELVGYANAFAQQSAGISPQIQNQPFEIAKLVQRLGNLFFRRLVEAGDVQVSNARPDQEMNVHAVARNLVAHQGELHRFLHAFARDADVYSRPLRPFEQIGDVAGAHVLGGFAVYRDDHVPRMNAGFIGRRAGEGKDHDDFIVARSHRHPDAVVFAALVLAHQGIRLGIEEIRMRIERVQHPGNRTVVDGLVGIHRFGIIVLDEGIDIGELLQAVLDVGVARRRRGCCPVRWAKRMPRKPQANRKKNTRKSERRELRAILISFLRLREIELPQLPR